MSPTERDGRGGARAGRRESPPRRLTEEPAPTPGSPDELVVAFLRAAEPYRTPLGRRARLESTLADAPGVRPGRALLRPAFALGLSLCAAAAVSAHLLGWPHGRLPGPQAPVERSMAASPVATRSGLPSASLAEPEPRTEPPPIADLPPPVGESGPAPQLAPARTALALPRRHRASTSNPPPVVEPRAAIAQVSPPAGPDATEAPARASTTAEEDAALALAALTALRRDHDPARARTIVETYLREHPDGSMAEEALAISLEAAAAHHDADAKALAARYLALYPVGTFRALARKTLRADAP